MNHETLVVSGAGHAGEAVRDRPRPKLGTGPRPAYPDRGCSESRHDLVSPPISVRARERTRGHNLSHTTLCNRQAARPSRRCPLPTDPT